MFATFALWFPFEMFDGIGDVDIPPGDPGLFQCFVQNAPGRSDKWMALQIFLVAGLLSDKDDICVSGAFAKHRLGRMLIEVATGAMFRRMSQIPQGRVSGNKRSGGTD